MNQTDGQSKNKAAMYLGRLGGNKTKQKLGKEHYKRIQLLSAKKKREKNKHRPFAALT